MQCANNNKALPAQCTKNKIKTQTHEKYRYWAELARSRAASRKESEEEPQSGRVLVERSRGAAYGHRDEREHATYRCCHMSADSSYETQKER